MPSQASDAFAGMQLINLLMPAHSSDAFTSDAFTGNQAMQAHACLFFLFLGRLDASIYHDAGAEPSQACLRRHYSRPDHANATPCRLRCRNHWRRRHFTASARPLLVWPLPAMTDFTTLARGGN